MVMHIKKRLLSFVLCLLLGFFTLTLTSVRVSAAPELISRGKPVTASTTADGYSPSNLTDGANNLWASAWVCAGQQYCIIDLLGFYTIDKIEIVGAPGNVDSRTYFRVTAAFDVSSGWTEIVAKPNTPHPENAMREYAVADNGFYRYVKIERTDYTDADVASNAFVLGEVSIYGASVGIEDLSTGKATVTASTTANPGSESNLADGNPGSYWESSYTDTAEKQYFTFDLHDFCSVSYVAVAGMFGSGNYESRQNFKILGSADESFDASVELVPEETEDIGENVIKIYAVGTAERGQYIRYVRLVYTKAGYRAGTEMTVYGKKAKFSALAAEYRSGSEPCSSLVGGTEVSLNAEVKNNTDDQTMISALLVLSKEGRIVDLAYDCRMTPSGAKTEFAPAINLPADVSGCLLDGYIFTDFADLQIIASDLPTLTALEKMPAETQAGGNTSGIVFDYAKNQMKVSLCADDENAGKSYFALVLLPDAFGNAQELFDGETVSTLKTKLMAVKRGTLDSNAGAGFVLPIKTTDKGGTYRVRAAVTSGETAKSLTAAEQTYLDGSAQKQIVTEIQREPKATLEEMLRRYCKDSDNEIMPEIDFSDEIYRAYQEEVLDAFVRMREEKAMVEVSDVIKNFQYALTLTNLKYNDITEISLDNIIYIFDLKSEPYFTEAMRSAVVKSMNDAKGKKAFTGAADVQKAFDAAVFLEAVSAAERSELTQLVEAYQHILGVSYDGYNALQVNKGLTGISFKSVEEFKAAFEKRKEEIDQNEKPTPSRPSGGGGGGKVSFTSEPVAQIPEENDNTRQMKKFYDIAHVSWAHEAIAFLSERGINGKAEGVFAPDDILKREEGAKMLLAALEFTAEKGNETFADARADAWYMPYLATVSRMGYFLGDENGNFGIGESLSREDFAVVLLRVLQGHGVSISTGENVSFADDGEIAYYAKSAVRKLTACGIINGMDQNNFCPKQSVTRAQAAKMLYGVVQFIHKGGANT